MRCVDSDEENNEGAGFLASVLYVNLGSVRRRVVAAGSGSLGEALGVLAGGAAPTGGVGVVGDVGAAVGGKPGGVASITTSASNVPSVDVT